MFRALPLLLIGLAMPLAAQEPGLGIVGEGTQTQSVELLNDSLSVTLESSGSLSLGRGDDNADGGLSVSVNDTTIVGASRGGNDEGSNGTPALQQESKGGTGAASGTAASLGAGNVAVEQASGVGGNRGVAVPGVDVGAGAGEPGATSCTQIEAGREQLIGALTSGQEIWMRPTSCITGRSDIAELAAQYPQLQQAVVVAGERFEDVVAITISNDFVILHMVGGN